MNRTFIKPIPQLQSLTQVERALEDRRAEILTAIGERTVDPTPELMLELAEINVALGEANFFTTGSDQ